MTLPYFFVAELRLNQEELQCSIIKMKDQNQQHLSTLHADHEGELQTLQQQLRDEHTEEMSRGKREEKV